MNSEKVVSDFASILEELTFNSRPIITTLTKTAEENISSAQQFVDAIERRIERCVPNQKLYAFYALDSICKNAGSPYTIYFSRNLSKLYRQTYLIVDNVTRTKLISMFKTWMVPTSTGELLFDKESLEKIEQFLIKASALHQKNAHNSMPVPTVPSLLKEIDRLAILTKERLSKTPNDEKLNTKIVVLHQLKQELQKEKMPPQALQQVQMQLRQIFTQEQQILWQQQQQQEHQNTPSLQNSLPLQTREIPAASGSLFGNGSSLSSSFFSSVSNILPPTDFSQHQKTNKVAKIRSLYRTLQTEGMLYEPSKESVVTLASKLETTLNERQEVKLPPLSLLQDILGDVRGHYATVNIDILNTPNLQLSQQTIMQNNPTIRNLTHLLYRAKPNKCGTCGKRFGNTPREKKMERDHLDWHFRINKRIKGSTNASGATTKNIQSRSWYLHDSQWTTFKDEEIVSTSRDADTVTMANPDVGTVTTANTNSTSEANKVAVDESKLRKKYVIVPETAEDMSSQCPICKDIISSVYDDDVGEWVWKNCVESQSKYFHATCFYEAVMNNQSNSGINFDLEKLKGLINE